MAFDGNGNYVLISPEFPFLPGTPIVAEDMNNLLADIAAAISLTLLKDGSNSPTVDMNWNGRKLTQLATGTQDGDAVNYAQVFKNPVFDNASAKASPAFSDRSLKFATTEWAGNLALNAALPGQNAGVIGRFLQTDGENASWVTVDGRGVSYNAVPTPAGNTLTITYSPTQESAEVTITKQLAITLNGFPSGRLVVMPLVLINAGLFPPTWSGIVWIKADGSETTNFSEIGVTWQNSGRDRVIVCSEPGRTPWAKVER